MAHGQPHIAPLSGMEFDPPVVRSVSTQLRPMQIGAGTDANASLALSDGGGFFASEVPGLSEAFDAKLAQSNPELFGQLDPNINRATSVPGPGTGGFDWKGAIGNFAKGAQGLASLAGIWNAIQQNKLQKKQFAANVAAMNRNIANQAETINNQVRASNSLARQMGSNVVKREVDGSRVA